MHTVKKCCAKFETLAVLGAALSSLFDSAIGYCVIATAGIASYSKVGVLFYDMCSKLTLNF